MLKRFLLDEQGQDLIEYLTCGIRMPCDRRVVCQFRWEPLRYLDHCE